MTTQTMNFKIDSVLKERFAKLAKDLGLSNSSLLTLLIKRTVDEQGIPFEVKVVEPEKTRAQELEEFEQMLTEAERYRASKGKMMTFDEVFPNYQQVADKGSEYQVK
jgi:DNA-damage-inducible protein J